MVSGLPANLDMSFVDLSTIELGDAYFYQVDKNNLQSSLLVVKTALNENVKEPAYQATFRTTTNSVLAAAICCALSRR